MLICPICSSCLVRETSRYVCEKGHSYDISKYGHVNLLMSQKGGNHGDSREMLLSRRNFLNTGAYEALRNALADVVNTNLSEDKITLLDSGCGECYYTSNIKKTLKASEKDVKIIGIDVSKDALRLASQRFGNECKGEKASVELAVASSYQLPIKDSSIDAVVSVFAPLCSDEFRRVLCDGGIFITVIPSAKHLWELKEAVYDTPYENEVMPYGIDGFEMIEKKEISGEFFLKSHEEILDLFAMTPYFCRTSEKDRKKLDSLENLKCRYDFEILLYKKI